MFIVTLGDHRRGGIDIAQADRVCRGPAARRSVAKFLNLIIDYSPIIAYSPFVLLARGAIMRRLGSGAGCGACGRGSHPRTREAGGHRPGLLRGSAFNGWTRTGKGGRKPAGALSRKHGPPDTNAAVARPQAPRFIARWIASQPPQPRLPARRSPHVRRGDLSHLGRHRAPRERQRLAV